MKVFDPIAHDLRGFQLIEASAGCGKTYTITSIVLRLIVEYGLDVEAILLVTFTEAAAGELKNRIRARIKDMSDMLEQGEDAADPLARHFFSRFGTDAAKSLRRALFRLDRASISTIHGFCRRVLSEQAFESGVSFDVNLTTEKDTLLEEIAHDYYANLTADADPLFLDFLEEKKFAPKTLILLMRTVFRSQELRILPLPAKIENPAPKYAEAYFNARRILTAEKTALETLFLTHPGINKRSYRKDLVPKWLGELAGFFSAAHPRMNLPQNAERFTGRYLADKMKDGGAIPQHAFVDVMDALLAAYGQFNDALVQLKRQFVRDARRIADKIKEEREIQTFDDLLHSVHSALRGPLERGLLHSLREKYKAVLIDEFQDTDAVQYEIFSKLFGGLQMPFFVIGDPKQSIYAFRGGDIYTYLDAVRDAGENRTTLNVNYRSDPLMIRAINTVFSHTENPFLFDEIQFTPVSGRPDATDAFGATGSRAALELRFVPRALAAVAPDKPIPKDFAGESLAALIATDIRNELGAVDDIGCKITPARFAVLTRTNTQAEQIRDALQARNISAVLLKDRSVFSTTEALDLLCLLHAVNEPSRIEAVRTATAIRLFNRSAADISASSQDTSSLEPWIERFHHWRELLVRFGIFKMFQSISALLVDGESLGAVLLSKPDGERVMTNYRHLMELAAKERSNTAESVFELVQWLERRISEARDGETPEEETELRLDRDTDSVRVLTMHKSKGLEFDIVYCPYLWESTERGKEFPIFHDPMMDFTLTADLSDSPAEIHLRQARFERTSEAVRLAYVAMTRAKQRCVVTIGAFKNMADSPAARLFFKSDPAEMDDERLFETLRLFADGAGGSVRVSSATQPVVAVVETAPAESKADTLHIRPGAVHIPAPAVTTSFTAMISEKRETAFDAESDVRGDDSENGAPVPIVDEGIATVSLPEDNIKPYNGLAGFERGAGAGTCLHTIFERIDFETPDKDVVEKTLVASGYAREWIDPVFDDIRTVLQCPLAKTDPFSALGNIAANARLNELAFLFPIAADGNFGSRVASLLAQGCRVCPPSYPETLTGMRDANWKGFLKGFIDLVFEYRGRYFVLDYKSNYLGPRVEDYHGDAMTRAMAEHHYFLQYHIYTAALHRYLGVRLPDYNFESHFGGVYYLFIRGMTGTHAESFGVFFDRPSLRTVQGLVDLFDGKVRNRDGDVELSSKRPAVSTPADTAPKPNSGQLTLPGFAPPEGASRDRKGRG